MTNLTITIEDEFKKKVAKKAKKEGATLTFLIRQFLKDYLAGNYEVGILRKDTLLQAHHKLKSDLKKGTAPLYKSGKSVVDSILDS